VFLGKGIAELLKLETELEFGLLIPNIVRANLVPIGVCSRLFDNCGEVEEDEELGILLLLVG
jgi:hypothetical protein